MADRGAVVNLDIFARFLLIPFIGIAAAVGLLINVRRSFDEFRENRRAR